MSDSNILKEEVPTTKAPFKQCVTCGNVLAESVETCASCFSRLDESAALPVLLD